LDSALNDVLSSIEQEVRARGAQIDVRRPLGSAIGHAATVRQILYNLVANGLKFVSPNQRPQIRISSERHDRSLRVLVKGSGIGIASQFDEKSFGLFQRLHSQAAYPGTGVGLAMVQKGVERMGGRIGMESEAGAGSCFWVELPVSEGVAKIGRPELQAATIQ